MKLAICNETYPGQEHAAVCADVAAAGFDGLELALSEIDEDPSRIDEVRAELLGKEARREGLEIVGIHWLLPRPPGLHLTTDDAAVRARTSAHLQHLARLCAAAGGKVMVLGSPGQRSYAPGDDAESAYARAFERFTLACRTVAETAGPLGVTLALEPLAPQLTNFMTTAAEGLRIIEAVDHPACKLHLDAIAMASEARPVGDIVADSAAQLVHVHVNDPTTMGGPGSGTHDQRPLLDALRAIDYAGYLSVEVFLPSPDGARIARESKAYLTGLNSAPRLDQQERVGDGEQGPERPRSGA